MKMLLKRIGSVLSATLFCVLVSPYTNSTFLDAQQVDESPVLMHFRAGQEAIQHGNNDLAVKEFLISLRLDPALVEARINLGLAYHMLAEYDLAVGQLSKGLPMQPEMVGANIVLGIDYMKLGLPEKAIAPLQQALALEPSNRAARRNLAAAYMAQHDYRRAVREFRKAFDQETDQQEAWYGLGHDYLNLSMQLTQRLSQAEDPSWQSRLAGDILGLRQLWNDATREYLKALALAPAEPGLHASLGNAFLHAKRLTDASNEFRSELRQDPNNIEALMGLAVVCLFEGNAGGALQNVAKVAGNSPEFLDHLEEFPPVELPADAWRKLVPQLEKSAPQPAAGFLLWAAYEALTDKQKADETRTRLRSQLTALEVDRTGPNPGDSGRNRCESHDSAACIKWLQSRVSLSPSDDLMLAKSHFSLGEFELAADAIAAVLAQQSKNTEALYWLVGSYTALADQCFNHLVAQFPDSWRAHQLRAETYHLQQADKDAIGEYQAAVREQPQDFEIHRALSELYLSANSLELARQELESALTLNPGDARALYLMGNWFIAERQPQKAIRPLEGALRFDPGLVEAHAALGKAFLRTGQAVLAISELNKATALDRYGDLHYLLFEAYRDLGRNNLAQTALARSQELRKKSEADDQARMNGAQKE